MCSTCTRGFVAKLVVMLMLITALTLDLYGTFSNYWYYGESQNVTRYFGLILTCEQRVHENTPICSFPDYTGYANIIRNMCIGLDGFGILVDMVELILFFMWTLINWKGKRLTIFSAVCDFLSGLLVVVGTAVYGFNDTLIKTAENIGDVNVELSRSFYCTLLAGVVSIGTGLFLAIIQNQIRNMTHIIDIHPRPNKPSKIPPVFSKYRSKLET